MARYRMASGDGEVSIARHASGSSMLCVRIGAAAGSHGGPNPWRFIPSTPGWVQRQVFDMTGARRGYAKVNERIGRHVTRDELRELLDEPDGEVTMTSFDGETFSDADVSGTTFSSVVFHACTFERADLSACTFTDVVFRGCRFISSSMERCWLNRVDFHSCSAPGLGLAKGRLTGVLFEDCQLRYADFSETTVRGMTAYKTSLRESAWRATKLGKISLEQCDLSRADVFQTALAGVDLSSCDIGGLVVSNSFRELRGSIIAPEQAVDLIGLLGVRIKQEE